MIKVKTYGSYICYLKINHMKNSFKKRQDFLNLNQRKLIDSHIKLTLQMETLCIVVNI